MDASQRGYRQVAATLRDDIISGRIPPGDRLGSQLDLARQHSVDVAVINRAVALLAHQGLVQVEHGRRTVVLERRPYWAVVEVPRAGERQPGEDRKLTEAAQPAVDAEPTITDLFITTGAAGAEIRVSVYCADTGRAASLAYAVARAACRDGWDLAAAKITAGPDSEAS